MHLPARWPCCVVRSGVGVGVFSYVLLFFAHPRLIVVGVCGSFVACCVHRLPGAICLWVGLGWWCV